MSMIHIEVKPVSHGSSSKHRLLFIKVGIKGCSSISSSSRTAQFYLVSTMLVMTCKLGFLVILTELENVVH